MTFLSSRTNVSKSEQPSLTISDIKDTKKRLNFVMFHECGNCS